MTHNSKRFEIFCHHSCRDSKTWTNTQDLLWGRGFVTSRTTDAELIVNTLSAKMALFAEIAQNVSALSQNVYFSFHVNNSMLECLLGSINFSQRLTFPQPTSPSTFIIKQDLDLPGLYLRQEPSVENSWYVSRMRVFSVSILVRQSKSQDDREIGKLFAPLWNFCLKIYKNSSLKVLLKILSLCPLSMFEHRSSTFTIAETGMDNMCSNLHHRDTTKCSLSLLLVCVWAS